MCRLGITPPIDSSYYEQIIPYHVQLGYKLLTSLVNRIPDPMSKPGLVLILALLLPVTEVVAANMTNQLKGHPSPYLAMHGNDPVKWQAWSRTAIVRAREQDKLLYVSVGYFSCHWCHVMQRESYQNKTIAALINDNFIPIKVDRELRPALDARLIDFVQRTRGQAGWPLNVFLTPAGHPLVGITYLPPDDFKLFIANVNKLWQQDRKSLKKMAKEVSGQMVAAIPKTSWQLQTESVQQYRKTFINQVLSLGDEMTGGFFESNKFPMTSQLLTLLKVIKAEPNPRLNKFFNLTLDQMARMGLHDHLAGGFFRYTVDPGWYTPHFEKMLYDNALLAELYFNAAKVMQRSDWEAIGRSILDFIIRELHTPEGG